MKVSSRLEGDLGEVGTEEIFDTLRKKCQFKDNGVILRLGSDQEYWGFIVGLNQQKQRAVNGASLVGGTVKMWEHNGIYADGVGWRIIIVPQEFQIGAAPGAGPPGAGPRLVGR